jgi:hypothetical protein
LPLKIKTWYALKHKPMQTSVQDLGGKSGKHPMAWTTKVGFKGSEYLMENRYSK